MFDRKAAGVKRIAHILVAACGRLRAFLRMVTPIRHPCPPSWAQGCGPILYAAASHQQRSCKVFHLSSQPCPWCLGRCGLALPLLVCPSPHACMCCGFWDPNILSKHCTLTMRPQTIMKIHCNHQDCSSRIQMASVQQLDMRGEGYMRETLADFLFASCRERQHHTFTIHLKSC
jgi:hypothetical protein